MSSSLLARDDARAVPFFLDDAISEELRHLLLRDALSDRGIERGCPRASLRCEIPNREGNVLPAGEDDEIATGAEDEPPPVLLANNREARFLRLLGEIANVCDPRMDFPYFV